MFKNRNNNNYNEGFPKIDFERLYYEITELDRKVRNLNNRLRRVEAFLGLRNDENNEFKE